MSINVNDKNLGHATAYAYYKAGGGTMTEAEFTEFMADFGTASQTAVEAAQEALASKNAAQTAATTATNKASEATTAATTATTKAGEASTSASTATSAKDTAVSASQTATTKATEATTAAATAVSAKDDAVSANTAAQSAKTAAQTAQTGAETAAASVSASAAQIATNAEDISQLKSDLILWANIVNNVQYYGLLAVAGGPGAVPAGTPTHMIGYNANSSSANYKRIIYYNGESWANFGTKTIDDLPDGYESQITIDKIVTKSMNNVYFAKALSSAVNHAPIGVTGGPAVVPETANTNDVYYNNNSTSTNYKRIMVYFDNHWQYLEEYTIDDLISVAITLNDQKELDKNQLYLRVGRDTFDWSIGTMDYTTGAYTYGLESGTRVVSVNSVYATKGSKINVNDGYKFAVFMYSTAVSDTTDFVQARNFAQTGEYVLDNDYYIRLGIGTLNNDTLTNTDIKNQFNLSIIGESVKSNYGNRIAYLEERCSGDKYYATYETVEPPLSIDTNNYGRLSLIATKKVIYHTFSNPPIEQPQNVGYLYVDETTQKLYYSENKYNRPKYLCDFDLTVADNIPCQRWCAIITPDGDIIFLAQGKEAVRRNPIVYPHGDYSNPVEVDLSGRYAVLPSGMTTDSNYTVNSYQNFVIWGEYRQNGESSYNGEPLRIWKLTSPYTSPDNWNVKHTFYYSNTGDPWGQDPDNEISHIHTIDYDQYTNTYYCNTGDLNLFCRVLVSTDNGETWTQIAHGGNDQNEIVSGNDVVVYGQKIRALGYIFTEDFIYWATDADYPYHNLYACSRNSNGIADFATMQKLAVLRHDYTDADSRNQQRTYNLCLTRNPNGLLILDRAEPRYDGKFVLEFYSFNDKTVHTIDELKVATGDLAYRYGFGSEVSTKYQSTQENGIIVGGTSYDRKMSLDILNNSAANRLGVTKIVINER